MERELKGKVKALLVWCCYNLSCTLFEVKDTKPCVFSKRCVEVPLFKIRDLSSLRLNWGLQMKF